MVRRGRSLERRPRRSPVPPSGCSHARRGGLSSSEPTLDFRYVAFRVFCELLETSRSAKSVFAFGTLESQAVFSLLGHVHDHVADRIEDHPVVFHRTKVAE